MDDDLRRVCTSLADPLDQEENRLRSKIETLRAEIAVVAAELSELQSMLATFEIRYDARIGVLIVELDRLNLEIEEYQRRIESLSRPVDEWQSAEEEIQQEFKFERERIKAEFNDANSAGERVTKLPPEPDTDTAERLRNLYRQLARQYHPDLAGTDNERRENEQAMKRINAAMDARDLETLVQLELELPHKVAAIRGTSKQARISWAVAEIARLEIALATSKGEVAILQASSVFQLWEHTQQDRFILDRLENELRQEIETNGSQLDELVRRYHNMRMDTESRENHPYD